MRIEHVSHHVSDMILSISRALEFELGPFMRATGMPHPEVAPITWDQLTLFIDAIVEHAGFEALERVVGDLATLAPKSMALFAAFMSPERLYAFVNGVMGPTMYPMLISRHIVQRDGTLELESKLRDGFRPCENFFRVLRASQAAVPQFIGLPSATVLAVWHGRGGNYHIVPPSSQTLVSRGRRFIGDRVFSAMSEEFEREKSRLAQAYDRFWAASRALEVQRRELEHAARDGQELLRELDERAERSRDRERRTAHAVASFGLTPRQSEVFVHLLHGASDETIARSLGCPVEEAQTEVAAVLKRAGVDSRAALPPRVFGER
jgi:DNA-binding CsgD family transcriptional regulator